MTYLTGIDVSLRSVSICIVDERGQVCHEAKTAAQPAAIVQCLRSFDPEVNAIGLEAATLTQYLTYGLQAAGFELVCMEARQVKNTLASMRNKTDRNDARGIAQILRTGACTAIACVLCSPAARRSSRSAATLRTSCADCFACSEFVCLRAWRTAVSTVKFVKRLLRTRCSRVRSILFWTLEPCSIRPI